MGEGGGGNELDTGKGLTVWEKLRGLETPSVELRLLEEPNPNLGRGCGRGWGF